MDNNFDLSQYSDREIIRLQKEKKKEYIILIQSERIAKKLLNNLGESLFTTNYHYRLNTEYYMINERVAKKKIKIDDNDEMVIKIPRTSIICRLLESKNVLLKNGSESYERYSDVIDELIKKLNNMTISIIYKDGDLYFIDYDNTLILIDDNTFNNYFNMEKDRQLTK